MEFNLNISSIECNKFKLNIGNGRVGEYAYLIFYFLFPLDKFIIFI